MRIVVATLVLILITNFAKAEESHRDHEALRALLQGATAAVNQQQFDNLSQFFHPRLRVTTVNQDSIIKPNALEPFFRSWVGEEQYVHQMNMSMEADELTEFYGQGESRFGIARGQGTEEYSLADGRQLELKTRWTATVTKDDGGNWKILALHIGTNFYRNPIVAELQSSLKSYALIALIVGLSVGLILGFLIWGRRNRKGS